MKSVCFVWLLVFTLLTSSFTYKQQHIFKIEGKTIGIADSTLLYLDDASASSSVPIDSAIVINSRFHFSGTLSSESKQVIIRTKNFSDYKFFWLEGSIIAFQAEKGKFREAVITGSKTQSQQDQLDVLIKKTGNEKEQSIIFIQHHPASIISADILSVYATTWGKDTAAILYHTLSVKMKATSYGKKILEFITLNKNIKIGDPYVDFTQPDTRGTNVSLSDFKGKVVLLEFWGSWCGPCREGNPDLVKIYNEFRNKDFEILGVAADNKKNDWINAVQQDSLAWKNVSDLGGDKNKAVLIYGISYYPANFLIDRKGNIIAKDLRGEELRKKLIEILH